MCVIFKFQHWIKIVEILFFSSVLLAECISVFNRNPESLSLEINYNTLIQFTAEERSHELHSAIISRLSLQNAPMDIFRAASTSPRRKTTLHYVTKKLTLALKIRFRELVLEKKCKMTRSIKNFISNHFIHNFHTF